MATNNFTIAQRNALAKVIDRREELEVGKVQSILDAEVAKVEEEHPDACYELHEYIEDNGLGDKLDEIEAFLTEHGLNFESSYRGLRLNSTNAGKFAVERRRRNEANPRRALVRALQEQANEQLAQNRDRFALMRELLWVSDTAEQVREMLGIPEPPYPAQRPMLTLKEAV